MNLKKKEKKEKREKKKKKKKKKMMMMMIRRRRRRRRKKKKKLLPNLNHQSTTLKDQKSKQPSTDKIPRSRQASKILKDLPTIGIRHLTRLLNFVLFKGFFPAQ
jgi:hypothetical protein